MLSNGARDEVPKVALKHADAVVSDRLLFMPLDALSYLVTCARTRCPMSLSNTQPNIERARRTMTFDLTSGQIFVPVTPDVADEFGKNPRTIKRWIEDDRLGFPRPVRINGRLYLAPAGA